MAWPLYPPHNIPHVHVYTHNNIRFLNITDDIATLMNLKSIWVRKKASKGYLSRFWNRTIGVEDRLGVLLWGCRPWASAEWWKCPTIWPSVDIKGINLPHVNRTSTWLWVRFKSCFVGLCYQTIETLPNLSLLLIFCFSFWHPFPDPHTLCHDSVTIPHCPVFVSVLPWCLHLQGLWPDVSSRETSTACGKLLLIKVQPSSLLCRQILFPVPHFQSGAGHVWICSYHLPVMLHAYQGQQPWKNAFATPFY